MKPSHTRRRTRTTWLLLAFATAVLPALAQDPEPQGSLMEALRQALKSGGKPAQQAETGRPVVEEEVEPAPAEPVAPPRKAPEPPAEPPDIHVSPQGRVEMHVNDLDLACVLQVLSMQSQRNIVASRLVTGTVTANLYNVTFEEALTAILDGNNCGWREQGNFIYVYTREELKELDEAARPPRQRVTRIFRLRYARSQDVQTMVQPLLSSDGKVTVTPQSEVGIASGDSSAGGNNLAGDDCLLVVDYEEEVEEIARAIAEIDVRPRQVLIEATILRAQLNEDNALGIDFNIVGGIDFEDLNSVSVGGTNLATGQVPSEQLNNTTIAGNTDFRSAVPNGGFTFGIIKNSVASFVRALEQVTDTTVLANPKLLTLNKQSGEVIVGRRDGYLTTTVTQTAAVQNVEFLETGTQLRFRPFIGNDGYIRMEVHPEDSTGGLTAANLPFEQTTEVTTNILVRDGHTVLIGGLFREVTSSARGQIPVVGNIPFAGALFRNSRDNTQREEVIILLTVHIVKEDDSLAEESRRLAEDIERYRVGMRRGLQWFGRERLAQAHYQWALEHVSRGHLSRALWDLDLAVNNNPKFLAAIKLREELSDKRRWEDEGSTIRSFLTEQIMREEGVVTPPFGRPGPPFDFFCIEGPNGFEEGSAHPAPPPEGASATTRPAQLEKGDS